MSKRKSSAIIDLPPKIAAVFSVPRGSVRYRGAYGGRGSGKSFSFAKMSAVWGYSESLRILGTRDLQVSIKESFYAEVKNAILSEPWLNKHYDIGESYISGRNGTEFIFRGLRHNISSIKSMAQIDLCIVEEAEDVPESSWRDLIPTIRADRSEIWPIWNPRKKGSPTDARLRKNIDGDMLIAEVNYCDNPWFPAVLEKERQRDQRNLDPSIYSHIWDGDYLEQTEALVLNGKYRIDGFTPSEFWDGPYYGIDWGFANDPMALVKCWIFGGCLFIEYEAYGAGVEIDETPEFFDAVPGSRDHVIRADNARPEMISHCRRQGFKIVAAKKGPGSVEDGIAFLRGFDWIVIHPRCSNVIKEAGAWSYKIDRLSGDILPVLVDADNHAWDAIRYALEPIMKNLGVGAIDADVNDSYSGW